MQLPTFMKSKLKEDIIMPQTYDIEIGLDLHKNFSVLAAFDQSGQLISMNKLSNNTTFFNAYLIT